MTGLETRSVSRDSLFLLANVRVEQKKDQHRVRVRNLSDGGMMGEGRAPVARGNRVEVELRNVRMGRRVDLMWVVEQGLEPGETVVVDGIQRLRTGVQVVARPWEPPQLPEQAVPGA